MKVLVVGAGIAGPTLAYWLARSGHHPTLLERAPGLRTGGYVIDFWGVAFDIAEEMDILSELLEKGYEIQEVRMLGGRDGHVVGGFDAEVFRRMTDDRFVSLPRSELSASIYGRLDERTERIFGDEVVAIDDGPGRIRVTLKHGGTRDFDLVVGADGLHSSVRRLAFGPESGVLTPLGYEVAAFEAVGYPHRDENVYVLYTEKGLQVGRFSMRGDKTLFLFVYTSPDGDPVPTDTAAQRARIRARCAGSGWEIPEILARLEVASDLYCDPVAQIRAERWTKGRVALVGDAAYCVSLLAGQGSALGMIGAKVLAGELHAAGGDHREAFERYEARLRPLLRQKQLAAEKFAGAFAPKTSLGLWMRNVVTRLLTIPFVAEWAMGRDLRDTIELPDYFGSAIAADGRREPAEEGAPAEHQPTLRGQR